VPIVTGKLRPSALRETVRLLWVEAVRKRKFCVTTLFSGLGRDLESRYRAMRDGGG
jgi:hypothetical protein